MKPEFDTEAQQPRNAELGPAELKAVERYRRATNYLAKARTRSC